MRRYAIAAIFAFCLIIPLFLAIPTRSVPAVGEYDPWADTNDDGKIDMKDIGYIARMFGATGTAINKTELLLGLQAQIDSLNASLTNLINETRNIYEVEIKAHCPIENKDLSVEITKNGIPSGYNTTGKFILIGDNTFTVPLVGPNNHTFTQWNTGSTNNTITVTSAGEYIAYYHNPDIETIVFFDDFNDGNANGWTVGSGTWNVISEEYFVTVGMVENGISTVDGLNLTDCIIETKLKFTDSVGFHAGIIFRYTDNGHYYSFEIGNEYDSMRIVKYSPVDPNYGESMTFIQPSYGNSSTIINAGTEYNLTIVVQGSTFTAYFDGQQVLSCADQTYTSGTVGLRARRADVYFDNFTVTGLP